MKELLSVVVLLFLVGCISTSYTTTLPGYPNTLQNTETSQPRSTDTTSPNSSPTVAISPTPTPELIRALPDECGRVGLTGYQGNASSELTIPEMDLEQGKVIVVNSSSDEVNASTTNVDVLLNNPGPDGISLREALLVVNNDPDQYNIHFDPSLKGSVIQVGSWDGTELPPLTGGSLIMNGDIDGDGSSDITLENSTGPIKVGENFIGFAIRSSHNTIHALRLVGFGDSILFDAPDVHQVYTGNTISNLVLDSVLGGVNLYSGRFGGDETADDTGNAWVDTLMIGNTIHAMSGIGIGLHRSSGDRIENLMIVDNTIVVAPLEGRIAFAISLAAGFWMNEKGNAIHNVVIANNSIEGDMEAGLYIASGAVGSSDNIVENVYISGNHIKVTRPVAENGAPRDAVMITTGDGATSYINASYQPVTYPEDNEIREIWLTGNVIEGQGGQAVTISSGCCGAQNNWIHGVYILGNEIRGVFPGSGMTNSGIYLLGGGSGPGDEQRTAGNRLSNVFIQQNVIEQTNQRTAFGGQELVSGGIAVAAGAQSERNNIEDIWIVSNQIKGPITGISLIGGWSQTPGFMATDNTLSGVRVWCNTINSDLTLLQPFFPDVKGITLAGGYGPTRGNRVTDILMQKNVVAGVADAVSVFQNAGSESVENVVDYQPH